MRAYVVHSHVSSIATMLASKMLDRPGIEEMIAFAVFIYDRILKLNEKKSVMGRWFNVTATLVDLGLEIELESKILIPGLCRLVEVKIEAAEYSETI